MKILTRHKNKLISLSKYLDKLEKEPVHINTIGEDYKNDNNLIGYMNDNDNLEHLEILDSEFKYIIFGNMLRYIKISRDRILYIWKGDNEEYKLYLYQRIKPRSINVYRINEYDINIDPVLIERIKEASSNLGLLEDDKKFKIFLISRIYKRHFTPYQFSIYISNIHRFLKNNYSNSSLFEKYFLIHNKDIVLFQYKVMNISNILKIEKTDGVIYITNDSGCPFNRIIYEFNNTFKVFILEKNCITRISKYKYINTYDKIIEFNPLYNKNFISYKADLLYNNKIDELSIRNFNIRIEGNIISGEIINNGKELLLYNNEGSFIITMTDDIENKINMSLKDLIEYNMAIEINKYNSKHIC